MIPEIWVDQLYKLRCRLNVKQRLLFKIRKVKLLISRNSDISKYIESHKVRKIQIGCGPNPIDNWLNTDIDAKRGIVYIDATMPLPIPDNCFDYVFSEHMFEHISYREGSAFLRETYRILKSGGKIRIATPDLEFLIRLYNFSDSDLEQRYIRMEVDNFIEHPKVYTRSNVINNFFYNWGHRFIYDYEMLAHTLCEAGFSDIQRLQPKLSDDIDLRGLEKHGKLISDEFNAYESIVLEARKP